VYGKFEALAEEKRRRIINATLAEFSAHTFKNASTDKIAAAAEISKGALFEYFRTKKQLYLYLLDYALNELVARYDHFWIGTDKDPLNVLQGLFLLKLEQMKRYPALYDFLGYAYIRETDPDLVEVIHNHSAALQGKMMREMLADLDYSRFRPGLDPQMMMNVVTWTLNGYSDSEMIKLRASDSDFHDTGEWGKTVDAYFNLFRTCFYSDTA